MNIEYIGLMLIKLVYYFIVFLVSKHLANSKVFLDFELEEQNIIKHN